MASLASAPVLSTASEHVFEDPTPAVTLNPNLRRDAADSIRAIYEVARTAREIVTGKWTCIGLQFPDHMLCDSTAVVLALEEELATLAPAAPQPRLYVLADTSYSACCVDEIAAEHVDAQAVVHYGRSCLSPTARLPVIYVFTRYALDIDAAAAQFAATFPDKLAHVVVDADVTFHNHVAPLADRLRSEGYVNLVHTTVLHDPTGSIPNRALHVPTDASAVPDPAALRDYALFHISEPPSAVLLALVSRFRSLHVLPTGAASAAEDPTRATQALLRRRFARVLSLATAGVVGILVNTLSVANYMASVDALRARIAAAGKKSYTVVVGKLNPAKLANFAEIDGWVVVGCWESGLVEDDRSFFKDVVTPFEMGVALLSENERTWGLEWWGGLEGVKLDVPAEAEADASTPAVEHIDIDDGVDGEESAPPEFDLRTGQYVSTSRPMRMPTIASGAATAQAAEKKATSAAQTGSSLVKRETGELATVNGVLSPGAEYLRSKRTWQGLGSDFTDETSTVVEQGLRGVARGYAIGDKESKV
ncbi:hypothetical protein TD95_000447 [Thielaviopsis punctulata]|uniref:2-(3-amino-3-carboxypropyl)histidine synthase subunit 2 n=1 Tax=Thielaviopsis punctulata TaxID=72032 RepID=A0A0F4ZIA4_9PEZI|nr:hypothetical protein TD95_000447 [Thielaviopsis punctulata]